MVLDIEYYLFWYLWIVFLQVKKRWCCSKLLAALVSYQMPAVGSLKKIAKTYLRDLWKSNCNFKGKIKWQVWTGSNLIKYNQIIFKLLIEGVNDCIIFFFLFIFLAIWFFFHGHSRYRGQQRSRRLLLYLLSATSTCFLNS